MNAKAACDSSVMATHLLRSDTCVLGIKSKQKRPEAGTADKRQNVQHAECVEHRVLTQFSIQKLP